MSTLVEEYKKAVQEKDKKWSEIKYALYGMMLAGWGGEFEIENYVHLVLPGCEPWFELTFEKRAMIWKLGFVSISTRTKDYKYRYYEIADDNATQKK